VRSVVRRNTCEPDVMTWKRVMSNDPAVKSDEVGYWKVPGPLSSPVGSVTSITVVPPTMSPTTATWAYPVPPPDAAVTVSTLVPNPIGTSAENEPSAPAIAVAVAEGGPVSVSVASTSTWAPGTVVPVTVAIEDSIRVFAAGAVTETGTLAGGAWVTDRSAGSRRLFAAPPPP